MNTASSAHFDRQYQRHLKHLKLKGLQPKTIEAYARAIRRIGERFDGQIDDLTEVQLTDPVSHGRSAPASRGSGLPRIDSSSTRRPPRTAPGCRNGTPEAGSPEPAVAAPHHVGVIPEHIFSGGPPARPSAGLVQQTVGRSRYAEERQKPVPRRMV